MQDEQRDHEQRDHDAIEKHAADAHAAGYEPTDAEPGEWLLMTRPDGTAVLITPDGPRAPWEDAG